MKLRETASDILNLYNYFTGAIIVDESGTIIYYYNSLPEVNSMKSEDVVGKNVLQVYTNVIREESSIYQVLETGEPIIDKRQKLVNLKGDVFYSLNSTFPIKQEEEIIGAVEIYHYRAHEEIQHVPEVNVPKGSMFNLYSVGDIISESKVMENLKRQIVKVAGTDSSVLLYGETGAGKELVAQAIHTASKRRNEKFVSQNCAAIPVNLLESILFGTVKGSYTDARNRPGLFELANGGTLFLDEIHSLEWKVQAKLLKAIEEQEIYRVGGTEPIPVDVRIITAVNREPQLCVADGLMREDLYYRLRVVQLNIPGLRERREDLDSLTAYFIEKFNARMGKQIKGVSEEVHDFIHYYQWAGNVRELRNAIECAFNFAQGEYLQIEDMDSYEEEIEIARKIKEKQESLQKMDLRSVMKDYEKEILSQVLESSNSVQEASDRMHITKQTLYNKIKEFSLEGMIKEKKSCC